MQFGNGPLFRVGAQFSDKNLRHFKTFFKATGNKNAIFTTKTSTKNNIQLVQYFLINTNIHTVCVYKRVAVMCIWDGNKNVNKLLMC